MGTPLNGLRVLVVDDELALANLAGSYLTRDGFDVSMARDGLQATDQARQIDPDVMVLDLGLPLIDGVEVCRSVRTFSDCYIVMLTARTEDRQSDRPLRRGGLLPHQTAASAVGGGHYDVRVPGPWLGPEFDALASGFNQMAGHWARSSELVSAC